MKKSIKYTLQKLLGIKTYLFRFACFKIKTLKRDKKEAAFFGFLQLLKDQPGDILDIGANLGVLSYHAARFYPDRTVYAFEPIPLNLCILYKVRGHYKLENVEIEELALAESNKEMKMVLPKVNNITYHGLAHVVHPSITEYDKGENFLINAVTLDSWCQEHRIENIAGIKMDVENYEQFVLKGGQDIIRQKQPIILAELWENENRDNCFEFLKTLDYNIYIYENRHVKLYDPVKHKTQNFIFIPASKKCELKL